MMELEQQEDAFEIPPESKISRTLTDRTIKTVIVMVLLLLFMLPTLSRSNWDSANKLLHEQSLRQIVEIYDNRYGVYTQKDYIKAYNHLIENEFMKDSPYPIIFLEAPYLLEDKDSEKLKLIREKATEASDSSKYKEQIECKCGTCTNSGTLSSPLELSHGF